MIIDNFIYDFRKELQNLGYSEKSCNYYPKYVRYLLEFTQENPQNITDIHLKNYYNYLLQKPKKHGIGIISKSHAYSQLLAIRLFFDYLQRIEFITENPYTLQVKKAATTPRIILTQKQIQTLYKNCQSQEETILLHLCYGCGLRKSEAQNLSLKDINFEQKKLYVRKGKGQKRRVIPITDKIVKDFKKYFQQSQKHRNVKTNSFLIDKKGNSVSDTKIYSIFKTLLKQAQNKENIPSVCLHSLRHSIATHLLENEMTIEMVRDFLGHKSLNTTQIYTRVNQLKMK